MLRANFPTELLRVLNLLEEEDATELTDHLKTALMGPIEDLGSRPSKGFRGRLVELSFQMASNWEGNSTPYAWSHLVDEAKIFLENVHLASLIVDDIQDGSLKRRGDDAIHVRYGLPIALNSGNWLYFSELSRLKSWNLPAPVESRLIRLALRMFNKAHLGQACDLGLRIDDVEKEKVSRFSRASMRLKTGALSGFSLSIGPLTAGLDDNDIRFFDRLGRDFGVALQMFDDLGPNPLVSLTPKQEEDFRLRRITWWFSFAAETLNDKYFYRLIELSKKEDLSDLVSFLSEINLWTKAHAEAQRFANDSMAMILKSRLPVNVKDSTHQELRNITSTLKGAYEKL